MEKRHWDYTDLEVERRERERKLHNTKLAALQGVTLEEYEKRAAELKSQNYERWQSEAAAFEAARPYFHELPHLYWGTSENDTAATWIYIRFIEHLGGIPSVEVREALWKSLQNHFARVDPSLLPQLDDAAKVPDTFCPDEHTGYWDRPQDAVVGAWTYIEAIEKYQVFPPATDEGGVWGIVKSHLRWQQEQSEKWDGYEGPDESISDENDTYANYPDARSQRLEWEAGEDGDVSNLDEEDLPF